MSKVNYEKLEKALSRLREKYADYEEMDARPELRESDKDSIKESLIQRFEVCFDTLWKYINRHLEDEQLLVKVPNSPKPLFRFAHERGLIDKDILERLFDYAQTRIDTSHDYSMEKAENALSKIGDFILDASEIYQTMITWE